MIQYKKKIRNKLFIVMIKALPPPRLKIDYFGKIIKIEFYLSKDASKFTPAEYRRSFWKKKRSNLKWLYNETLSIHNSFLEKSHLVSYEFLLENNLNWILFTLSTVTYLDMLFRINKQKTNKRYSISLKWEIFTNFLFSFDEYLLEN